MHITTDILLSIRISYVYIGVYGTFNTNRTFFAFFHFAGLALGLLRKATWLPVENWVFFRTKFDCLRAMVAMDF